MLGPSARTPPQVEPRADDTSRERLEWRGPPIHSLDKFEVFLEFEKRGVGGPRNDLDFIENLVIGYLDVTWIILGLY